VIFVGLRVLFIAPCAATAFVTDEIE